VINETVESAVYAVICYILRGLFERCSAPELADDCANQFWIDVATVCDFADK
jgi:hypothetical protein